MYTANNYFESDLMNSYAWDTATLFLQVYDDRASKPKMYSRQDSIVAEYNEKGTNNPKDSGKIDKICNVYDMASNYFEWTMENFDSPNNATSGPCVIRGGSPTSNSNYFTNVRYSFANNVCGINISFRHLLYIKSNNSL